MRVISDLFHWFNSIPRSVYERVSDTEGTYMQQVHQIEAFQVYRCATIRSIPIQWGSPGWWELESHSGLTPVGPSAWAGRAAESLVGQEQWDTAPQTDPSYAAYADHSASCSGLNTAEQSEFLQDAKAMHYVTRFRLCTHEQERNMGERYWEARERRRREEGPEWWWERNTRERR